MIDVVPYTTGNPAFKEKDMADPTLETTNPTQVLNQSPPAAQAQPQAPYNPPAQGQPVQPPPSAPHVEVPDAYMDKLMAAIENKDIPALTGLVQQMPGEVKAQVHQIAGFIPDASLAVALSMLPVEKTRALLYKAGAVPRPGWANALTLGFAHDIQHLKGGATNAIIGVQNAAAKGAWIGLGGYKLVRWLFF